jgi:PIN domain nuclease of toxin-antitoxin system
MILLDTHVAVWDALKPSDLSSKAKKTIGSANKIYFCEVSLWEIAMLMRKKRLQVDTNYRDLIELILKSRPYELVGLNPQIAETAVLLPKEINADPMDRLISATALYYGVPLITADSNLRQSKQLTTIW